MGRRWNNIVDSSVIKNWKRCDENSLHSLRVRGALSSLSTIFSYTPLPVCTILIIVALFSPLASWAFPQRAAELQMIDTQNRQLDDFWYPFGEEYTGGMQVAAGDVDGDGREEIVVAENEGEDSRGRVRIFSGIHKLQTEFLAFPEGTLSASMDIAVGDIDGDGKAEIIVSQPNGPIEAVYIYDEHGRLDSATAGVVHLQSAAAVAVGNVVGDGKQELIIGGGSNAEPRVWIMNEHGEEVAPSFMPFDAQERHGLSLGVIAHHDETNDTLAIGLRNGGNTTVKIYGIREDGNNPVLADFSAWTKEVIGGVELAAVNMNDSAVDTVVVGNSGDHQAELRFFEEDGTPVDTPSIFAYEEDFRGGVDVATAKTKYGNEFVIVPHVQKQRGDTSRGNRYIEVNLSQQVEYLWEDGYLRNSYLISSGLASTPTPPGEYTILKKIASHVYDGRPEYYFPNTPWNLRFRAGGPEGNYYFHTAYWHNNFGHPMSHGCINMREVDAEFLYNWADLGTPATIHY